MLDEVSGSVKGILEIAAAAATALGSVEVGLPATTARELCEPLRAHCAWMMPQSAMLAVLSRDGLLDAYRPLIRPGTRLPPRDLDSAHLARYCFGPEPSAFPPLPFLLPCINRA